MNKISATLVLTIVTFSLSCMNEQPQRKQLMLSSNPYSDYNEIPLQPTHYNPQQYKHTPLEANEPGWQVYDKIMNAPYHNRQQKIANSTDLKPIYLPFGTNKEEKEKLLKKNISIEPDNDLIKKLYDQAYTIISKKRVSKSSQPDSQIAKLINDINQARDKNINEDVLANNNYKTTKDYFFRDSCTILLFHLIKNYTLEVNQTKEPLPFTPLNALFTDNGNIHKPVIFDRDNIASVINNFPAFFHLTYNLHHMIHNTGSKILQYCLDCLYSHEKITFDKDISYSANFKNDFYNQTKRILTSGTTGDLYPLIHMIENANNQKYNHSPHNFTEDIAHFQPPKGILFSLEVVLNDFFNPESKSFEYRDFIDDKKNSDNIHRRIVLFCKMIEQYI